MIIFSTGRCIATLVCNWVSQVLGDPRAYSADSNCQIYISELPLAKIVICAGLNGYTVQTRKYMHQPTELFVGSKNTEFVRQEANIMRMPWFHDGSSNTWTAH